MKKQYPKAKVLVHPESSADVIALADAVGSTSAILRAAGELDAYYLDVLAFRPVSLYVADEFQVHHESPQILLVVDGVCVYDASQLDITIEEVQEALTGIKI